MQNLLSLVLLYSVISLGYAPAVSSGGASSACKVGQDKRTKGTMIDNSTLSRKVK